MLHKIKCIKRNNWTLIGFELIVHCSNKKTGERFNIDISTVQSNIPARATVVYVTRYRAQATVRIGENILPIASWDCTVVRPGSTSKRHGFRGPIKTMTMRVERRALHHRRVPVSEIGKQSALRQRGDGHDSGARARERSAREIVFPLRSANLFPLVVVLSPRIPESTVPRYHTNNVRKRRPCSRVG